MTFPLSTHLNIKVIRAHLKNSETRFFILLFVIALITGFTWNLFKAPTATAEPANQRADDIDTYIPDGFVLVPIEISNEQSLDGVLGPYGSVDLYLADPKDGHKGKMVASYVKLMRAPLNQNQYAVLVEEASAPALVQNQNSFFVVVRNRSAKPNKRPDRPKTRGRSIITETFL